MTPGQAQEVHGFSPSWLLIGPRHATPPESLARTGLDGGLSAIYDHGPAIRLLGGQLSLKGFEANGEGLQVISPGHSQPLEYLLNSLIDGSTKLGFRGLALLLHPGLEDTQLDEGMVDPSIDLGLEFLAPCSVRLASSA